MKRKITLLVLETILAVFLIIMCSITIDSSIKNIKCESLYKNFISKCKFEFESNGISYYKWDNGEPDTIHLNFNEVSGMYDNPTMGSKGDIFTILESNVNVFPFSRDFIGYHFGGHAGLIIDDKTICETSGMTENGSMVTICPNNLLSDSRIVLGLRVKTTDEIRDNVVKSCYDVENTPYNKSFLFNRKKTYYCTDLVSRLYKNENVNLDNTMIYTSASELLISKNTYLIFAKVTDKSSIKIYYMG